MTAPTGLFLANRNKDMPLSSFEYAAIPAPIRSEKAKNAKTPSDRFALTLTDEINRMAADGWEYLRAETLPSEERSGLTGRTTLFHNLLIFRRETGAASRRAEVPAVATAPVVQTPQKPAVQDEPNPAAEASPVFSETMRVAEPASQNPKPAG